MGTYSTWEFYETFGGWPEPGETYPDDPDAARDELEEGAQATMRCNRCQRPMRGTTAYDGACACGGLIEPSPIQEV